VRLNIASGYEPTEGFTNLDVNPNAPGVDIVGPMYPLQLPDGSVEEIRATNCLEHLPYRQSAAALKDWARVLVRGGRMFLQVPDAETICEWLLCEPWKLVDRLPPDLPQLPEVGAAWRLLGGQEDDEHAKAGDDWKWNAHYALFTPDYLREILDDAGFEVESLTVNVHPNCLVWCVKP